jgi:hypothetical protein
MTQPKCTNCDDSGKTHGSCDLDCTQCSAAQERSRLNLWLHRQCRNMLTEDKVWAIYQRGKAALQAQQAELVESLRIMWGWAIQCGEQFTPEHDDVDKADWRRQCDEVAALLKNYPRKP